MVGDPFVALLESFADALERQPVLAERIAATLAEPLAAALAMRRPEPARVARMTVRAYSVHAGISERTLRYYLREMEEGVHFVRVGRRRGRILIEADAADAWCASRATSKESQHQESSTYEEVVTNEIVRRRAHVALKKRGLR
jgi:hypothetical protein